MLRLFTFGGLGLETDDASPAPHLRRPQLAVLAVLAASGDRGVSRERLASLFWADSDEEHARHSARQVLYALRQELGGDVVRSNGSTLKLDPNSISSDVAEFRAAISTGSRERAVELAKGLFLDGFYLPGSAAFERWVEEERGRVAAAKTAALLALATDATRAHDLDGAVEWWRHLTSMDPLSGRYAVGFLKALATRGNRAEALAFARQHELVLRRELEADPDPDVKRIEAELRSMPATSLPVNGSGGGPAASPVIDANGTAAAWAEPPSTPNVQRHAWARVIPRALAGIAALLFLAVSAAFARERGWLGSRDVLSTFAVGLIREEGLSDSLRHEQVMTDMLATNLARVNGLRVLANTRLLELLRPGADSAARYAEAARRAGATALLEGVLSARTPGLLMLELRRVELRSGLVTDVYRAEAADRHALVDSLTRIVAAAANLPSPTGSVAEVTTRSLVAYRFYEEGLRAYYAGDLGSARRLIHAALTEDSSFAVAAWYEARFAASGRTPDGRTEFEARERAMKLAGRAPERERLTITASLLHDNNDPRAIAVAESLIAKYPDDPRALLTLSRIYSWNGNWTGAVTTAERAIALDSIGDAGGSDACRLCDSYVHLAQVYSWWDSLPSATRAAHRFHMVQPQNRYALDLLAGFALRLGDTASAAQWHDRRIAAGGLDRVFKIRLDLLTEAYDDVEREVRPLLASASSADRSEAWWAYFIALRNQGRLREARSLTEERRTSGTPVSQVHQAIIALDMGDAAGAMRLYERAPLPAWPAPGVQARDLAWRGVRIGMTAAAAGDTARVRTLVDSVEQWGRGSLYGRDRRLHHYLRGRLHALAGRDADAVIAYQAAIHSPSLGLTRINYDMGGSLMRLGRSREAVAILQAALRGGMDASNLYLSRTELRELLAQAFVQSNQPDSAAKHYRAVVKAWEHADPMFQDRRAKATAWLLRYAPPSRVATP